MGKGNSPNLARCFKKLTMLEIRSSELSVDRVGFISLVD